MFQSQADQQLATVTNKFFSFLTVQLGQELKPEKISSFFDSVRQVNFIYEPIKEFRQTRPEVIKGIILELKGYLVYPNLVDVIFKTVIQLFTSVSFGNPSQEVSFKDIFADYFFNCKYKDKDAALDMFFLALSEIKSLNPRFWWYLLCTYEVSGKDDRYLKRLKIFIDQFVRKPINLISVTNKNTITCILYLFENDKNQVNRIEIIKNSLFLSMPITLKLVNDSKTLPSITVSEPDNKNQTYQVLSIIYELGKEVYTNFLKVFPLYINRFDSKKTITFSNDHQIESIIKNGTWLCEILRLRKIFQHSLSIINDEQEYISILQDVISEFRNEALKNLLTFAAQFDSHDNSIIIANNDKPEYAQNVISFLGHLSVVFAPLFLKINEKEIVSFSDSYKNKNKRLKIFTKEAKFMEEASKMCTDPLRLEKLLCEMERNKCLIFNDTPTLFLSLKEGPEWNYDEAIGYVNKLIESYSGIESQLLSVFISRIAVIQSFLINQGLGIDHHFLANFFFDRCLNEISVERIRTAFMIVESSSLIEDCSEKQRNDWIQYLTKGFESTDSLINAATSKVFLHCLTHLTLESLCLIEMFLKVNQNPSIDFLTALTSIYSLCYNNETIKNREEMMDIILTHVQKYIKELQRDEVTLGLLITLLFEEINSEKCENVSPGLVEAFDLFLSKDEKESYAINEPLEPLRMLSIFPNYYNLINPKYPTFFSQLIDCIIKIINNPKTDPNLMQLLVETIVDTVIQLDDSGPKFEEILKRIDLIDVLYSRENFFSTKKDENNTSSERKLSKDEINKSIILITAIDQFMARTNQPFKDLIDSKIPIPGSGKSTSANPQLGISSGTSSTAGSGMTSTIGNIEIDKSNFCAYIINSRYSILKVLSDESDKYNQNTEYSIPSIAIYAKTMTGSYGYNVKMTRKIPKPEEKKIKEVLIEQRPKLENQEFSKKFTSLADQYWKLDSDNIKQFENDIQYSFDADIAKNYASEFSGRFEATKPFEKAIVQPGPVPQLFGSFEKDEGAEVLFPSCQATAFFESLVLDSSIADKTNKKENSSFKLNYPSNQSSSTPISQGAGPNQLSQSSKTPDSNEVLKNASGANTNNNEGGANEASNTGGIYDGQKTGSDANKEDDPNSQQIRLLMEKKKKEKQQLLLQHQNQSNYNTSLVIKNHFPLLDIASSNIFSSPIRETIKIGFLYVKNGQSDQNSILQNRWDQVSPEFRSFIASIGTIIDLSTHLGFSGKLDNTGFSNGRYQLYFSTDRLEVMYHVAPLLPTDVKDVQQIYKKRHIGNDNVHVVWSEHTFDYDATTITSQFNDAHIIIYPIHNVKDFFRVVIYRKSPDYHFGPLRGEGIVSAKALPDLVRWTSVFSDRVSRLKTSTNYKLPNQLLSDSIRDVLQIKKK